MRHITGFLMVVLLVGWTGGLEARERPIKELPKDAADLASVWTEPIKSVAKESRRIDPIRGLWFGLIKGSFNSVVRVVHFFRTEEGKAPSAPGTKPKEQPLLRYNF